MKKEGIDYLLEQADQLLESARQELMRADEDVITHTVCVSARQAITHYLRAFLLQNGVDPAGPASLEDMLAQCRTLDARFDLVMLDAIHCRLSANTQHYCLSIDQVETCLGIALQTKDIVHAVTPGY